MSDIESKLYKEIQTVVKPYTEQIQELERKSQKKKEKVKDIELEIQSKKQEAEKREQEARDKLDQGEDPRELLDKKNELLNKAKELEEFLSSTSEKTEEDERISELKTEMAREVYNKIFDSKLREKQSEALLQALRDLVQIHDDWSKAVEKVCGDLGIGAKNVKLLEFREKSEEAELVGRINSFASQYSHLFIR